MAAKQAYDELIAIQKEISLLGSCAALLGWDQRVYMPPKGNEHRGNQLALLAGMTHEK
ncbi:MAG: carboxypeptidase M32, partial [Candidatus Zixiibacteriota bacterium]